MATYRIVCVTREQPHGHITAVGTGSVLSKPSLLWTIEQVSAAIALGDDFYTKSPSNGMLAAVAPCICHEPQCRAKTLGCVHVTVSDNNLDSLPSCD